MAVDAKVVIAIPELNWAAPLFPGLGLFTVILAVAAVPPNGFDAVLFYD